MNKYIFFLQQNFIVSVYKKRYYVDDSAKKKNVETIVINIKKACVTYKFYFSEIKRCQQV